MTDQDKTSIETKLAEPQTSASPIHVITSPPEVMALSWYMLSIHQELRGRLKTIDLKVSLPQEPFVPDTYRGREVRIVGALAAGADIGQAGLDPNAAYYWNKGTGILGGEDITPSNGGQGFYDFLSHSLAESFRDGKFPPELPGKVCHTFENILTARKEKRE